MIRGYAEPVSIPAGEVVWLRLSGDVSGVHVSVHRLGGNDPAVAVLGPFPLTDYPLGRCDEAFDWPAYPLPTDATWRSGAYVAFLHACRGGDHRACLPAQRPAVDGRDGRLLFVVRPGPGAARAPLLYKLPLSTYHAYNATAGGSLYRGESLAGAKGLRTVTLFRPGGGTGGELSFPDAVDVYDPATPREGVAHWDLPFLDWLERAGYRADVCTDLDLDGDPGLLHGYAALIGAGHDEYWTSGTRDAVERFVRRGGSAAFFSGNLCFWRVHLDSDRLHCRHPPVASPDCDQWWGIRGETALSGVSYRNGGAWWSGPRDPVGYTVIDAQHWVYDGTGLADGDVFGAEERLVGYECDAAALEFSDPTRVRVLPLPGEPAVHLLGLARLGPGWQDRPRAERAAATMVVTVPGGLVFTAGTTDWPRLLAAGHPAVDRITRNVLDRIGLPARRVHIPATGPAGDTVEVWVDADPSARVHWRASGGRIEGSGPRTQLVLPDRPGPVTLTADVYDRAGAGFGTRTMTVLTAAEAAQVDLLRAVRWLLSGTPPDPHPAEPAGPGNRQLADDDWQPTSDGLRRRLTVAEAKHVGQLAARVQDAAAVLARALATDRAAPETTAPAITPPAGGA